MKPKYIVIHNSLTVDGVTVDWQSIRNYHVYSRGWRDIGYHFGIERVRGVYEVLVGRMPTEGGAHASPKEGPYIGINGESWGVMFCGNYNEEPPPSELWSLGTRFVASLSVVGDINVDCILGHGEVDDRRPYCPGVHFDMSKFRSDVFKLKGLYTNA